MNLEDFATIEWICPTFRYICFSIVPKQALRKSAFRKCAKFKNFSTIPPLKNKRVNYILSKIKIKC